MDIASYEQLTDRTIAEPGTVHIDDNEFECLASRIAMEDSMFATSAQSLKKSFQEGHSSIILDSNGSIIAHCRIEQLKGNVFELGSVYVSREYRRDEYKTSRVLMNSLFSKINIIRDDAIVIGTLTGEAMLHLLTEAEKYSFEPMIGNHLGQLLNYQSNMLYALTCVCESGDPLGKKGGRGVQYIAEQCSLRTKDQKIYKVREYIQQLKQGDRNALNGSSCHMFVVADQRALVNYHIQKLNNYITQGIFDMDEMNRLEILSLVREEYYGAALGRV